MHGHLPTADDDTPLVGFMVDPEAAQIVYAALTKLAASLDCWCQSCRRDLPDMDAGTRDHIRERTMEMIEALDEQLDAVELDLALQPDAPMH